MDLIVLLETYLHECSFLVSFDQLVVKHHDCIGDPFGNIGVEMPFSGINRFIGSQTKMNVFNVFFGNLQNHQLLLVGRAILFLLFLLTQENFRLEIFF
jgi:hypothetical protein